ncbi:MAG: TonB-dependent receptor [Bacteroidia bacterium]|nr:TonB-dependent receptor [Bacteroidia bacterium]
MRTITYFFISFLACSSLFAQSKMDLDTVMIASQRIPQTIEQSGRDITVIEGNTLLDLPISSIDELLRHLPGVNVQSRGGFGTQADISLRGSTFSQVLMLIDGVRVSDPLTGHFNNYLPIAPSEIKRIEIIYGPSAALYGPDAVGGVIHIITYNFDGAEREKSFAEGQLGAGEFGFLTAQAGAGIKTKVGYLQAGVIHQRAAGQDLPPDSTDIKSDFNITTASVSLRKDINDWKISARAAMDYRDFNAQYFYTRSTFDLSRETVTQFWSQARVVHQGKNNNTSLDLAYKSTRDTFAFNPLFPANIHRTQFLFALLNHNVVINDQLSLAAGLQADLRDIVSTDRGDHDNFHTGLYVTSLYTPTKDLSINASLRADQDDNFGFELSPQLSINYKVMDGKLGIRAMGGRAIRAADFTERFISSQITNLSPGRNLGNPDLLAERSWQGELGVDIKAVDGLKIGVTGYYRKDNNLIDYGLVNSNDIVNNENLAPNSEYLLAQNILSVQTLGLESQVRYRFSSENFSLDVILGNQFLQTVNPTAEATRYLSNRARFLFSRQAIFSYKSLVTLSVQSINKIRERTEDVVINAVLEDRYNIWNAKLNVNFTPNIGIYGQVYNLGNVEYQDILGARLPLRWISGGVKFRLGKN